MTTNSAAYFSHCPARDNVTDGLVNLTICPAGERDVYQMFLLWNETIAFQLIYDYGDGTMPRDLDLRAWRWDFAYQRYLEVAIRTSTNDNESITFSTAFDTGNPEGWYWFEVHGKTAADHNYYSLSWTLNPPSGP